jgi:hypothetical protein
MYSHIINLIGIVYDYDFERQSGYYKTIDNVVLNSRYLTIYKCCYRIAFIRGRAYTNLISVRNNANVKLLHNNEYLSHRNMKLLHIDERYLYFPLVCVTMKKHERLKRSRRADKESRVHSILSL